MKKFLTVFLVALALFSFVGCDPAPKVPTEDELGDITKAFSACFGAFMMDSSNLEISDENMSATLKNDVEIKYSDSEVYIIKAGGKMTQPEMKVGGKAILDCDYTLNGKNHSLYYSATIIKFESSETGGYDMTVNEFVLDDVSYDLNNVKF